MCSRCQDTLVYYEDVEERGVLVRKLQNCDCREKRRFRAYCNDLGVLPERSPELEDLVAKQMSENGTDLKRSVFLNGQGIRKANIFHLFTGFLIADGWPEFRSYTVQNFIDAWFSKGRPIEGNLLLVTGYHEIHLDYWEDAVIATMDKMIQEGVRIWVYLDNNRFPELRRYCYQNLQRLELPGSLVSESPSPGSRPASSQEPVHSVPPAPSSRSSNAADRAIGDTDILTRRYS
jgi:hypothetical protein